VPTETLDIVPITKNMKSDIIPITNMTHPWLNAQDISTLMTPVARDPDRREGRVGTASNDLNLGEETIEDMHPVWCSKEGDKDDAILSYAVVEKDTDGHGSGGARHYLSIEQEYPSLFSTMALANGSG